MKKLFVAFVAVGLIAALAAPSFAAELRGDGALKLKHIITTEYASGQLLPTKQIATKRLTTMRANPRFQFIANEYAGFVWTGEIDVDWGDSSYTDNRGGGGAIAADVVNLENKNLYLHFSIPETPVSFRGGITGVSIVDNFILGTDIVGMRVLVDLGDTRINVDWLRLWDTDENSIVDDTDFWHISGSHKFGKTAQIGGFFAYLKDGSGHSAGSGILQGAGNNNVAWLSRSAGLDTATRKELLPATATYDGDLFYLGVQGNAMLGPVKLDGWAFYNFGEYEIKNKVIDDVDVNGFAATLRGSTQIESVGLSLQALYGSGSDKDDEFTYITGEAYQLAGAFYYRTGMMILMQDGDDINNSSALVYNASNIWENRTLGLIGVFAGATAKLPMNLSGKVGLGGIWSAEDRVANGETEMGYEINGKLTYQVAPNATIALNGAYAIVGDFYQVSESDAKDYNAASAAKANDNIRGTLSANKDPDDVYYTSLVFRVAM